MYMANVNRKARGPNATYIPLTRVGGCIGCAGVRVGCAGFALGAREFLDTNMFVTATQKSRVGGIAKREALT